VLSRKGVVATLRSGFGDGIFVSWSTSWSWGFEGDQTWMEMGMKRIRRIRGKKRKTNAGSDGFGKGGKRKRDKGELAMRMG
jgi:hypothetical protein